MTTYVPCAGSPLSALSKADTTGLNTGNLTTVFDVGVLGTMPPIWEVYRITIDTQTPGQTFTPAPCSVRIDKSRPLTFTFPVGGTEWNPSQPAQLRQGNELYFFWGLASSSTPVPLVTLYLRFDEDLPANRQYARGG